jgi:hypothetical protein
MCRTAGILFVYVNLYASQKTCKTCQEVMWYCIGNPSSYIMYHAPSYIRRVPTPHPNHHHTRDVSVLLSDGHVPITRVLDCQSSGTKRRRGGKARDGR